jgi:hypothetical protein
MNDVTIVGNLTADPDGHQVSPPRGVRRTFSRRLTAGAGQSLARLRFAGD